MRNDCGDYTRENETARERREHIKKEQDRTRRKLRENETV